MKKIAGWWIFSDRVAACIAGNFEFKYLKVITFSGVVNASFVSRLLLTIYRLYTRRAFFEKSFREQRIREDF